jgi:hypothetical protein
MVSGAGRKTALAVLVTFSFSRPAPPAQPAPAPDSDPSTFLFDVTINAGASVGLKPAQQQSRRPGVHLPYVRVHPGHS